MRRPSKRAEAGVGRGGAAGPPSGSLTHSPRRAVFGQGSDVRAGGPAATTAPSAKAGPACASADARTMPHRTEPTQVTFTWGTVSPPNYRASTSVSVTGYL